MLLCIITCITKYSSRDSIDTNDENYIKINGIHLGCGNLDGDIEYHVRKMLENNKEIGDCFYVIEMSYLIEARKLGQIRLREYRPP